MDAQEIGTMIQRLREQQNLTQKALAERLAVSDKTISKWETWRGRFQLLRHFAAEVTGRASDRRTYTHHSAGGI